MASLTETQERALEVLWGNYPRATSAREVAKVLWPDDPGWKQRTRFYGTNRNGALGATMWLRAGRVLSNLVAKGYAIEDGHERPVLYRPTRRKPEEGQ